MTNIIEKELIRCPECNCLLRKDRLKKHLRKVHHLYTASPLPKRSKQANPKPKKKNTFRTYYRCKQCKKKVAKSAVISHLNNAHDFHPQNEELAHEYYFDEIEVSVSSPLKANKTSNVQSRKLVSEHENLAKQAKIASIYYSSAKRGELIKCPICNNKLTKRKYKQHMYLQHSVNIYKELGLKVPVSLALKVESTKINKVQPVKASLAFSEDIFDRGKIVSGGAYGLGKNRRH